MTRITGDRQATTAFSENCYKIVKKKFADEKWKAVQKLLKKKKYQKNAFRQDFLSQRKR